MAIDWSKIPNIYTQVATDKNGRTYAYTQAKLGESEWLPEFENDLVMPLTTYDTNENQDWQQTLKSRPIGKWRQ